MSISFKNKKTAVVGLGIEGLSSALYLQKKGAQITVLDQKSENELDQSSVKILRDLDIKILGGKNYLDYLGQFDIVVRSPGIARDIEEFQKAEKNGVEITSQTKLFFDLCPCPIIGVTGTKGKGTTSALIYEMLKKAGKRAYLGGNIGKPPFDFLDNLNEQSLVVLELSSYQLQDLTKIPASPTRLVFDKSKREQASRGGPHIAVLLMVTSEHLAPDKSLGTHENYHKDLYHYIDAKRNILRFQTKDDFAIINRDYLASHESDIYTEGQVFQVSRERGVQDQGCYVRDGAVWVQRAGKEYKIVDTQDILLPGKHNLENVCAAVMAATLAGVSKENIAYVLKTFKGLEHRLELVDSVNGVRYYDDSFSTTPETAIAAIEAFKQPEVLILGGAHKGSDFGELGKVLEKASHIKAIIGIGLEWPRIKERIMNHESRIMVVEGAKDMQQIVLAASRIAQSGDVVLLSPACSSFDMFKNYKERGELFKKEVHKLHK